MKQWFTGILLLFLATAVFAQDKYFVETEISNDKPSANEKVELYYRLKYKGNSISLNNPRFNINPANIEEHFKVLNQGRPRNNMFNFNFNQSGIVIFEYVYILQAKQKGKVTINPVTINFNGNDYKSKAITIDVEGATTPSTVKGKGDIFVATTLNKSSVYVNEAITARFKLYSKYDLKNIQDLKYPSFSGFLSYDIDNKDQFHQKEEIINGVRYNVVELNKKLLLPQKEGALVIDPLEIDIVAGVPTGRYRRDFFGQRHPEVVNKNMNIKSASKKITVKPLPPAPPGYSGLVGTFNLKSSINKETVKVNDAINLVIEIKGTGNLKTLNPFEFNIPEDFETYSPKSTDHTSVTSTGVTGKRKFDYLLIPRHAGTYTIEPVNFIYFDIKNKKYVTKSTGQFHINVEKGEGEPTTGVPTTFRPVNKEGVELLGKDIRFIKTGTAGLREQSNFFLGSLPFYLLLCLPAVLFGAFLIAQQRLQQYNSDVVGLKRKRATKLATKRLTAAKQQMDANNSSPFYEEILKALYGYLGDKLNLSVSELSKEKASELLIAGNSSEATVNELLALLDQCEMARFSPVSDVSMNTVYDHAAAVIQKMEGELR